MAPGAEAQPVPMESLLAMLRKHNKGGDDKIGADEVTGLVKALDGDEGYWTDARLKSLLEGFGLDKGRMNLAAFARVLYDGPQAALYEVVREDLVKLMDSPEWDDGSYAPLLIRLAWHSSGTYNKEDSTGGSNGATMRFALEAGDPENVLLDKARELLENIKVKHSWISYADLWILASYVAIEHTCGPRIAFTGGRADAPESKAVAPGRLPGAEKGLADGMELDEDGRMKGWENLSAHIREVFGRMGMDDKEVVALLSGGHVYGRCHPDGSGYAGAWVENPTFFSNEYPADMIGDKWIAVMHDTKMPDGGEVPEEVRPAPGKRQYIDLSKYMPDEEENEEVRAAPDASEHPPGRYRCASQWVNCREQPDVTSDIQGRFVQNQELSVLAVKIFGTAIRGLTERGGWVSIVGSGGKTLFERVGDLESNMLKGRYRARNKAGAPSSSEPKVASAAGGKVEGGREFLVAEIVFGQGKDAGAVFGKLDESWVLLYSPEQSLLCELIVEGYNEKPRKPIKGQTGHQMMLVSDMVLLWDAGFKEHLQVYADDDELLKKDFGDAWKKLTELGCPWSKEFPGVAGGRPVAPMTGCPVIG